MCGDLRRGGICLFCQGDRQGPVRFLTLAWDQPSADGLGKQRVSKLHEAVGVRFEELCLG